MYSEQLEIKFTTRIMLVLIPVSMLSLTIRILLSLFLLKHNDIITLLVTPFFGVSNIYLSFLIHNSFTNLKPLLKVSNFQANKDRDSIFLRYIALTLILFHLSISIFLLVHRLQESN